MLLIALHSIRSERQYCEPLEYNLLYRWFLDMDLLEEAFDASTFSRNRERLMNHEVAALFFAAVREEGAELMSGEHFSVDGTLLEAWASLKSFRRKGDPQGAHALTMAMATGGATSAARSGATRRTSPRRTPRRS